MSASELRVRLPIDRDRCGTLAVIAADGRVLLGPIAVAGRSGDDAAAAGGNPRRLPTLPYGDTPLGGYRIVGFEPTGAGTAFDARIYGEPAVIVLEPRGGEAALADAAGRFRLLVQGGATGPRGALRATSGALRLHDRDLARLVALVRSAELRACRCEILDAAGGAIVVTTAGVVLPDPPPTRRAIERSPSPRRAMLLAGAKVLVGAAILGRSAFVWAQAGGGGGGTDYDGGPPDGGAPDGGPPDAGTETAPSQQVIDQTAAEEPMQATAVAIFGQAAVDESEHVEEEQQRTSVLGALLQGAQDKVATLRARFGTPPDPEPTADADLDAIVAPDMTDKRYFLQPGQDQTKPDHSLVPSSEEFLEQSEKLTKYEPTEQAKQAKGVLDDIFARVLDYGHGATNLEQDDRGEFKMPKLDIFRLIAPRAIIGAVDNIKGRIDTTEHVANKGIDAVNRVAAKYGFKRRIPLLGLAKDDDE